MPNEKKKWTLSELEELVGKEQVTKLFIEHYLTIVGKDNNTELADGVNLEDIME